MMSLMSKIVAAYKENAATVVCGMAMMNGNTNVYELYRAMSASDNK
jgi:plastocyanin domain-containing protein